jgi:hypothetical protein
MTARFGTSRSLVSELPGEISDAIENGRMNPALDHLNDLLKEQKIACGGIGHGVSAARNRFG